MNKKHTFKWVMIIILVILGGITIGTIAYIYAGVSKFDQVFAPNVWIEGVDISGLTRQEATEKIQSALNTEYAEKKLILFKEDILCEIPFKELRFTSNMEEVLDVAYQIGHEGSFLKRYQYMKQSQVPKKQFEIDSSYEKTPIEALVETFKDQFYIAPIDASISRKNKQFVITDAINGRELDVTLTAQKICDALETEKETPLKVEVATKEVLAKYTKDSFKDIQNSIASFYTSYNNADLNRNINLRVGAEKINSVLMPGETFSLADHLEPITFEGGYRESKVIVNGKLEQGIGGGICQIASTLYNALLLTNIDISMRQNHSLPVAYVPLGRDATYATGSIDFKFKNNSEYPLVIESYCENNKVYVNVFAHPSLKPEYDIKFDSVTTEVIKAPETKYINDPTLEVGTKVEEQRALDGKKVKLYKLYYKNGELINKELVNNSYYKPRAAIVKVGTKAVQPVFKNENPSTVPKVEEPTAQKIEIALPSKLPEEVTPSLELEDPFKAEQS